MIHGKHAVEAQFTTGTNRKGQRAISDGGARASSYSRGTEPSTGKTAVETTRNRRREGRRLILARGDNPARKQPPEHVPSKSPAIGKVKANASSGHNRVGRKGSEIRPQQRGQGVGGPESAATRTSPIVKGEAHYSPVQRTIGAGLRVQR